MIALEAGIVIACVAIIYAVGFMFAETSDANRQEPSIYSVNAGPHATPAPSGSAVKGIVLALVVGGSVFFGAFLVQAFWADIQEQLGFAPPLNETAESDIDEIPAAPAVAGPVPEYLLPCSWQPRVDRMLDFNRRTLAAAYEKVGKRSPDWDESALLALELTARQFSFGPDPQAQPKDIHTCTRKALDAGCDDPLILYIHYRFADNNVSEAEIEQGFAKAAKALQASKYPPFRRLSALNKALESKLKRIHDPVIRAQTTRLVSDFLRLLAVSGREDEPCLDLEAVWHEFARAAYDAQKKLGVDSEEAWRRVGDKLATAKPLEATRWLLRGDLYIQWAWEARGSGYANMVPKDRWRIFDERLTFARDSLEKSWELSPGRSASYMLSVELGKSRGRAEMEKWFERAIQYDPSTTVCGKKLEWLHPKWHGSTEEMLAFGRACRDSKNWERSFPLIMVDAHLRMADMLSTEAAKRSYFRRPDVAADIVYVYAKCVERSPNDASLRSRYAYHCYLCGHPRRAHKQFQQLGDKLWWDDFFTEAKMKQVRAEAAKYASLK